MHVRACMFAHTCVYAHTCAYVTRKHTSDRQKDRQTDRQTNKQTDRHRARASAREAGREKQICICTYTRPHIQHADECVRVHLHMCVHAYIHAHTHTTRTVLAHTHLPPALHSIPNALVCVCVRVCVRARVCICIHTRTDNLSQHPSPKHLPSPTALDLHSPAPLRQKSSHHRVHTALSPHYPQYWTFLYKLFLLLLLLLCRQMPHHQHALCHARGGRLPCPQSPTDTRAIATAHAARASPATPGNLNWNETAANPDGSCFHCARLRMHVCMRLMSCLQSALVP